MKPMGVAYNISKRNKMAKGGMACAHGGPAYCNKGCYSSGGEVDAPESNMKAQSYEESMEEPMKDKANLPSALMKDSMDSMESIEDGDMDDEKPMKMAKGGMMHAKHMAKAIMMAKGGIVSMDAHKKAEDYEMGLENHSGGESDREDIDVFQTTPYDDKLSSEEDYPLAEEEGYEEGHQAKMRRKGGLLDHVMSRKSRA